MMLAIIFSLPLFAISLGKRQSLLFNVDAAAYPQIFHKSRLWRGMKLEHFQGLLLQVNFAFKLGGQISWFIILSTMSGRSTLSLFWGLGWIKTTASYFHILFFRLWKKLRSSLNLFGVGDLGTHYLFGINYLSILRRWQYDCLTDKFWVERDLFCNTLIGVCDGPFFAKNNVDTFS